MLNSKMTDRTKITTPLQKKKTTRPKKEARQCRFGPPGLTTTAETETDFSTEEKIHIKKLMIGPRNMGDTIMFLKMIILT